MRPRGEAETLVKHAILLVEELTKKTQEITQLLMSNEEGFTARLRDLMAIVHAMMVRAVEQQ